VFRLTLACLAAAAALVSCGDDGEMSQATAAASGETPAAPEATPARKGAVVRVVSSQFGRVVADRRGEALYLFDKEQGERSRCYGECAKAWPPLLAKGKPRAGGGANRGLLGTTRRRDGKRQVTYAGHPLYYYVDDSPGQILCHNVAEFGGLWLVVKPNGTAVS
jgi:predicted lipoprotein with Yx(FWY)xxD motif